MNGFDEYLKIKLKEMCKADLKYERPRAKTCVVHPLNVKQVESAIESADIYGIRVFGNPYIKVDQALFIENDKMPISFYVDYGDLQ